MYNIDFTKLKYDVTLPFRRRVKLIAWVQVMLSSVTEVYNLFNGTTGLKKAIDDRLLFTGQVLSLEALLTRDYADTAITDGLITPELYVFSNTSGLMYPYLYSNTDDDPENDAYCYSNADYQSDVDFIVTGAYTDLQLPKVKAAINMYKPAGKRFKVIQD